MANKLGIARNHEEVLRHLSAHLATLPDDYDHFDMATYCRGPRGGAIAPGSALNVLNCGTTACAIGHLPSLGYPAEHGDKHNWSKYSARVTGISQHSLVWDMLFAGYWEVYDNTPRGAAKRILFVLNLTPGEIDQLMMEKDCSDIVLPYQTIKLPEYSKVTKKAIREAMDA